MVVASAIGWLPLPVTPEVVELIVGTLVVATLIMLFAATKTMRSSRRLQRSRAVRRSLSCSAIVDLHSKRAIDACADMYQAFEERSPGGRRRPSIPRTPSLPTLEESENESSTSGSFVCRRTQSFPQCSPLKSKEFAARASESQSAAFVARHLPAAAAWLRTDSTAEVLADEDGATEVETTETTEEMSSPRLIVLGAALVGKSSVIDALQAFAAKQGVALNVLEGLPACRSELVSSVPLLIWDAVDDARGPLCEYVRTHTRALVKELATGAASGQLELQTARLLSRLLVLCNKTDLRQCPAYEREKLPPSARFVEGSARDGTGVAQLWRLVEACAVPMSKGLLPTPRLPHSGESEGERDWWERECMATPTWASSEMPAREPAMAEELDQDASPTGGSNPTGGGSWSP